MGLGSGTAVGTSTYTRNPFEFKAKQKVANYLLHHISSRGYNTANNKLLLLALNKDIERWQKITVEKAKNLFWWA